MISEGGYRPAVALSLPASSFYDCPNPIRNAPQRLILFLKLVTDRFCQLTLLTLFYTASDLNREKE